MKKNFSKFLAAVLAMMMALSAVGTVGADDGNPTVYQGSIKVENGEVSPTDTLFVKNDDGSFSMEGDIEAEAEGDNNYGLWVESAPQAEEESKPAVPTTVTVDGNVKLSNEENLYVSGVHIQTSGGGTVDTEVTGEVCAETNIEADMHATTYGVQVETQNTGEGANEINGEFGSVSAKNVNGVDNTENQVGAAAYAVRLDANADSDVIQVTVDGSVQAEAEASVENGSAQSDAAGIYATTYQGTNNVTVGGSVTASSKTDVDSQSVYVNASSRGIYAYTTEGENNIVVKDDVSATAELTGGSTAYSTGVYALVNAGINSLTLDGKVSADTSAECNEAYDLRAEATGVSISHDHPGDGYNVETGGTNTVTVKNDISASVNVSGSAAALFASAYGVSVNSEKGSDEIEITGNVSAETTIKDETGGYISIVSANGVYAEMGNEASAEVTVTGDVEASLDASEAKTGDIFVANANGVSFVTSESAAVSATLNGNIKADAKGEQSGATGVFLRNEGGTINVTLVGDVGAKGENYAAGVAVYSDVDYDLSVNPDSVNWEDTSDKAAHYWDYDFGFYPVTIGEEQYSVCCIINEDGQEEYYLVREFNALRQRKSSRYETC